MPEPVIPPVGTVAVNAPVPELYAVIVACILVPKGSAVRAMIMGIPATSDLLVWIVRDCAPSATVKLVVLVAEVPGAFAAVVAELAAFVAELAAFVAELAAFVAELAAFVAEFAEFMAWIVAVAAALLTAVAVVLACPAQVFSCVTIGGNAANKLSIADTN